VKSNSNAKLFISNYVNLKEHKMKKIILFLAGVMAVAAFAPQASALPLFARQTGMACSACHFQHFPMLNNFGRIFKAAGYTMVGAQVKVEDEGLSIPGTLNMAVLSTMGYAKTNATSANHTDGTRDPADGTVYVPGTNGEFSLFVGGRVSENAGALAELGMLNDAGTGAGLASAKFPMLWEVASDTRAGLVPFTTNGQGASYGYEVLNTGANAVHTMLFIGGDFNGSVAPALSAQQYIGTGVQATGAAFVVNSSKGFINLTKFNQVGPADMGGTGAAMTSTYMRVAGTFDMAGWDTGVGIQNWRGSSTSVSFADTVLVTGLGTMPVTVSSVPVLMDTKASAIDGQLQGQLGKMPVGFYVTYAKAPYVAPVAGGTSGNTYNGGTLTKSSFNLAAELGVIPEKATVGFGIRRGKSGVDDGTGANATDNAVLIEASYKLAQNMLLNLVHTSQSGGYWGLLSTDPAAPAGATNAQFIGSKQTYLNMAVIF
jgi:hypothetical protein